MNDRPSKRSVGYLTSFECLKLSPVTSEVQSTPERAPSYRWLTDPRLRLGLVGSLVLYAVIRLTGLVVLALGSGHAGRDLSERLHSWDGHWFARIASGGYPGYLDLGNVNDETTGAYAFLPGYPSLVRALSWLGVSVNDAGLIITAVAGIVAAAGIYCYVTRLTNNTVGVLAVGLWAALPMSIVLSMMYSEALFVALAVWALYAVLVDQWLTAGVLALAAGLVRTSGLALGIAIFAAAAGYLVRRRRAGETATLRPEVGAIVSVLGVPLWWLYVAIDTGRADGWFAVQDFFWGSRLDFGAGFLSGLWDAVTFSGLANDTSDGLAFVVNFASVAGLLAALIPLVSLGFRVLTDVRWLAPAVYSLVLLGMAIGSAGYLHSKLRFLVPMFPLVIPIAIVLARGRRTTAWSVVVLAALMSAWWGGFMLLAWQYAI